MMYLHFQVDKTQIVYKLPDRENIFIEVVKQNSREVEESMNWLIEHMLRNGRVEDNFYILCI